MDERSKRDERRAFIETARELGCDETGEAFEKAFAKIVPPRLPSEGLVPKQERAPKRPRRAARAETG